MARAATGWHRQPGSPSMLDLAYLALGLGFYALAALSVRGCERI
ncbi:hypothetical protein [Consotaella aegiceratis]